MNNGYSDSFYNQLNEKLKFKKKFSLLKNFMDIIPIVTILALFTIYFSYFSVYLVELYNRVYIFSSNTIDIGKDKLKGHNNHEISKSHTHLLYEYFSLNSEYELSSILDKYAVFWLRLSSIVIIYLLMITSFLRALFTNPGFVFTKNKERISIKAIKLNIPEDCIYINNRTDLLTDQIIFYEDSLKQQNSLLLTSRFIKLFKEIIQEVINKYVKNHDHSKNYCFEEETNSLITNSSTVSNNNDENSINKYRKILSNNYLLKACVINRLKKLNLADDIIFINEKNHKTEGLRICLKCEIVKPDRSHHCDHCGCCVLRCDHHCPWVNNCIGFNNYKFFYLLILYSFIAAIQFIYFLRGYLQFLYLHEKYNFTMVFFVIFYVVLCCLAVALFLFNCFHLMIIFNNMTTYEYSTFSKTENEYKFYMENKVHKYFIDALANFKVVMGENICEWFLPLSASKIESNYLQLSKEIFNRNENKNHKNRKNIITDKCQDKESLKLEQYEIRLIYEFYKSDTKIQSNGVNFKLNDIHDCEIIKSY